MQLDAFGKLYEIPEEMITNFMVEFRHVTEPGYREYLEDIRDMSSLVLETLYDDPELLDFEEYRDDFIKAHAMRQALAKYGILFDA